MRLARILLLSFALAGTFVLTGGAGCSMVSSDDDSGDVDDRIADVDRIEAPSQIAPSDTLRVRLHGTVGPNGCYSFHDFEVERSADRLRITPVVHYRSGGMCTMAIVPLDETYRAAPPFDEGQITLEIPQTDGEDVTATVIVSSDSE